MTKSKRDSKPKLTEAPSEMVLMGYLENIDALMERIERHRFKLIGGLPNNFKRQKFHKKNYSPTELKIYNKKITDQYEKIKTFHSVKRFQSIRRDIDAILASFNDDLNIFRRHLRYMAAKIDSNSFAEVKPYFNGYLEHLKRFDKQIHDQLNTFNKLAEAHGRPFGIDPKVQDTHLTQISRQVPTVQKVDNPIKNMVGAIIPPRQHSISIKKRKDLRRALLDISQELRRIDEYLQEDKVYANMKAAVERTINLLNSCNDYFKKKSKNGSTHSTVSPSLYEFFKSKLAQAMPLVAEASEKLSTSGVMKKVSFKEEDIISNKKIKKTRNVEEKGLTFGKKVRKFREKIERDGWLKYTDNKATKVAKKVFKPNNRKALRHLKQIIENKNGWGIPPGGGKKIQVDGHKKTVPGHVYKQYKALSNIKKESSDKEVETAAIKILTLGRNESRGVRKSRPMTRSDVTQAYYDCFNSFTPQNNLEYVLEKLEDEYRPSDKFNDFKREANEHYFHSPHAMQKEKEPLEGLKDYIESDDKNWQLGFLGGKTIITDNGSAKRVPSNMAKQYQLIKQSLEDYDTLQNLKDSDSETKSQLKESFYKNIQLIQSIGRAQSISYLNDDGRTQPSNRDDKAQEFYNLFDEYHDLDKIVEKLPDTERLNLNP